MVTDKPAPSIRQNDPALWSRALKWPDAISHKHNRGRVMVLGGGEMTGAARLVALAARRGGGGWVAIVAPETAFELYATTVEPGTIVKPFNDLSGFKKVLDERRPDVCVLGPGAGVSNQTRDLVLATLAAGVDCVIDADGLTAFADEPEALFTAIAESPARVVLTPHVAEFERLFPDIERHNTSPLAAASAAACAAAKRAGATVILKGSTTIIAPPDGGATADSGGPPDLATAGTGDVLAGLVAALLAQGMTAMDACGAAVWLHGRAAQRFVAARGPGLIAEDLIAGLPEVLAELKATLKKGTKAP